MSAAPRRHPLPEERWPTADEAAHSLLFSPLELASGLRLADRTWVPAMVPWRATEEGDVTPDVLDWYRRFAEGQPGTLVVEATGIREVRSGPLLRIGHDRFLPGLRELVRTVREASGGRTRLLIQVIDFLSIRRRPDPRRFLGEFLALTPRLRDVLAACHPGLDPLDDGAVRAALLAADDAQLERVLAPRELEALRQGARERVTDMHLPHVAELPARLPGLFADAAARAAQAGFDGVELHYAHAYTMASFLSRLNDRPDGYGGSRAGRLRLPLEVLAAVRARVGPRFTVGLRFLGEDGLPGGSTVEDAAAYGAAFARAGADVLSVSRGGKFEDARQPKVGEAAYPYTGPSGALCMPTVFDAQPPFGANLPFAAAVRAAVRAAGCSTPVVASGGINAFALAEAALQRGDCDLVGAARQSLADPDWFRKLREGRGERIVRCLYTNYCEALDQRHKQVTCQLWDRVRLAGETPVLSADGHRRLVAPRGDWSPPSR
ncbi:MAG TPA: NADH:flavin oxidoreductase [Planctomycetota bacterium]|nr:NADH:flavin oxidoreductase [Planctomycetota bacterium]